MSLTPRLPCLWGGGLSLGPLGRPDSCPKGEYVLVGSVKLRMVAFGGMDDDAGVIDRSAEYGMYPEDCDVCSRGKVETPAGVIDRAGGMP